MDHASDAQLAIRGRSSVADLDSMRRRGASPALIDGATVISYDDLAARIERRQLELGTERRVVSLRASNSVDTIVTYVACLASGHVVSVRRGATPDPFTDATASDVHPDLAVLMSTSGSTGSAKSVRLSLDNVDANAHAIAEAIGLSIDDVAITALPLHYCYGLSIVTSHLVSGAAVVVTDTSVVDPCFWELVDRWGVTTLSGVPHTFELLERVSGSPLEAPSLRRITQAGGRLDPKRVRALGRSGQALGWDFFVMYGQTEATARMATLDPRLVEAFPQSIGRAIPGGSFRLGAVPADELPAGACDGEGWRIGDTIGELIYCGPNVMLGYATSTDDLARGRDLDELRTGDLARRLPNGLYEIIGRRSEFVKILGHRIDLQALETNLRSVGLDAAVAGTDERLVVAVVGSASAAARRQLATLPLPHTLVHVVDVTQIPRLDNGKVARCAILGLVPTAPPSTTTMTSGRDEPPGRADSPTDVFRAVLGVDIVRPKDSFVSLGGDSLSFVETSIRLERVLGDLPDGWHLRTLAELDAMATAPRRRRTTRVETSVVIRAVGICIIVATHMRVARLTGGAHTLLAVAGYNFARFHVAGAGTAGSLRRGIASVARVGVPASLWIGLQMLLVGGYSAGSLFLVNNYFGSAWRRDGRWEYWYFEAFVQIFLLLALLLAIRPVRRLVQRHGFVVAFAALIGALVVGLELVEFGDDYNNIFRPHTTVWFVLLGWAGYEAANRGQRLMVTAVLLIGAPLYFDRWQQALMVSALVGALLWVPTLRLPRGAVPVLGAIAGASMVTFLIHWQVWPMYSRVFVREVSFVLTMATGIAVWLVGQRLCRSSSVRPSLRRLTRPAA